MVNPAAGGGRCGERAPEALSELERAGLAIDVVETERPGDGTRVAREAWADGRRDFIAVGGDGTAYEVVNGLFPSALSSEARPSLGFLPLGTGNSFLREFTEEGAAYAREALIRGRSRASDVLLLRCAEGDLCSINIIGLGFTAEVAALTNRRFKRFGESGYTLAVVAKVIGLGPRVFPMALDVLA